MHDPADEELVRLVQQGHISSYETLIRRYQQKLYSFVLRILKNPQDAQDAVQETFIHVYEHIERFDVLRSFASYIFPIARNEAITLIRKKHPHIPIESIILSDEKESHLDALVKSERNEELKKALEMLDSKYRRVLELYYFDDLSYEDIGTRLSIPINSVRTLIRRGKSKLKVLVSL